MENKTVRVLERKLVANKSYENLCQVVMYHHIDYLRRSIQMSQGFCFANNRLDLSRVLSPKEAKRYYDDAIQNITNIYKVEEALIDLYEIVDEGENNE